MNFKSTITNMHDFKKNGYKIIKKLHKLEKRKNLKTAYSSTNGSTYFWVISVEGLINLLKSQYGTYNNQFVTEFLKCSNDFVTYINNVAKRKGKISKKRVASYLHSYTKFYNKAKGTINLRSSINLLSTWYINCVMPYYSVWKV